MENNSGLTGTPGQYQAGTRIEQTITKVGLVRMETGSQHRILLAHGAEYCVAADPRDHPRVKALFFCQHANCAGRTWPTLTAMRASHPDRVTMTRAQETHVYGIWCSDVRSTSAAAEAKEILELTKKHFDECKKMPIKSLADHDVLRIAQAELAKAEVEYAKASSCIGLISPPEEE